MTLDQPVTPTPPTPGLLSRLRDGARIAFFLRVPAQRLAPRWLEIIAAMLLTVCLPTLFAVAAIGGGGRFASWELSQALLHLPLFLAGTALIAWLVGHEEGLPTLLFATLLAWLVIDAIGLAAWWIAIEALDEKVVQVLNYVFYYVPLAWLALATARFAITLAPVRGMRQIGALLVAAALIAVPLGYMQPERSLWVKAWSGGLGEEAERRSARGSLASEDAFYRQPELLARELAAVEPGRKGVVDVFFVGMAGYGGQDVFMREVNSVAALMRERFGAEGRTIKLINNTKTALAVPIASATSLRAALKRVAEQMDVEEDVLVLFLTSHGSATHRFSLELWPLRFKELTPATLREALDESGIRHRVVVVSACYSGGFVEKLASADTLVITAAAPDKNSFGCSNENDWTYFGKAYFDEALRKTYSFTQAFEAARPVIAEREKAQKYDPSNPQAAEGSAIRAKLAELERQLAAPAPAPAAIAAAPPAGKAPDVVERYMALTFDKAYLHDLSITCRNNMRLTSPQAWLEKEPETFGGMEKSNVHWPRLLAAWDRHAEEYCTKANEPRLVRAAYEEQVRALLGEKDIAPILGFLSSETGRSWMEKDREVGNRMWRKLGKVQDEISTKSYRVYVEEQAKIIGEFRKETEAPPKR